MKKIVLLGSLDLSALWLSTAWLDKSMNTMIWEILFVFTALAFMAICAVLTRKGE